MVGWLYTQCEEVEKMPQVDMLFELARDFETRESPLQAIKCLEAVASADPPFLPQLEAEARANLGMFLSKYTHNMREAKVHLERTLRLMEDLSVSPDFKFNVIAHLVNCHESTVSQTQLLKRGTNLAKGRLVNVGSMSVQNASWYVYFRTRHIQLLVSKGDMDAALEDALSCDAELKELSHGILQLQMKICVAQIYLMMGNNASASEHLKVCTNLLQALRGCESKSESQYEPTTSELEIHVNLLTILYQLRVGSMKEASVLIDKSVELVRAFQQGSVDTKLTPLSYLQSLVDILKYTSNRLSGTFKADDGSLQKSALKLDSLLDQVDVQAHNSARNTAPSQHFYLALKFLLHETLAIGLLTQCKIQEAVQEILAMISMVEKYKMLLDTFEISLHLLIGSCMMLCGLYTHAEAHFRKACNPQSNKDIDKIASIQMSLFELEASTDCPLQMAENLKKLSEEFSKDERNYSALLFCNAVLKLQQNDLQKAKMLIQEALKHAHSKGHHQIIILCLIEHSRILWKEGDQSQMKESIQAAISLAANLQHVPSLLSAMALANRSDREKILQKWSCNFRGEDMNILKEWQM